MPTIAISFAVLPSATQSLRPRGSIVMWRARPADDDSSDHAAAHDVQHDHFTALCVGHVRVPPVRMRRRVPRLAEAAEDADDLERLAANETDDTELRVGDDRRAADRLDAARLGQGRHVASNPSAPQVDGDQPRLEIRGHERNFGAEAELSERPRRKNERRGSGDECASVHDSNTLGASREVPGRGSGYRAESRISACSLSGGVP